ncbi:hypothetical protein [Owenweeksia hongkongensis]|uniref:hypothetical protein n=1 Tax=Owenweeksia hongkongensis TaxID=253245 RepID=UPI003A9493CF
MQKKIRVNLLMGVLSLVIGSCTSSRHLKNEVGNGTILICAINGIENKILDVRVEQVFETPIELSLQEFDWYKEMLNTEEDSLFIQSLSTSYNYQLRLFQICKIDLNQSIFPLTLPESKDFINSLEKNGKEFENLRAIILFSGFEDDKLIPYQVLPLTEKKERWLYDNYTPALRIRLD